MCLDHRGYIILIFYPSDQRKCADHFYLSLSQSLMSPFITSYSLFTLKHQVGHLSRVCVCVRFVFFLHARIHEVTFLRVNILFLEHFEYFS